MPVVLDTKGIEILVDEDDFKLLSGQSWTVTNGYAMRKSKMADGYGYQKTIYMHREVLGLRSGDGVIVDHINGVRIDNRKGNLRVCTHKQNLSNKKRPINNKTGYKGVSIYERKKGPPCFKASIKYGPKTKHLGLFETPELAHEFYCLAADMTHGEFSNHG